MTSSVQTQREHDLTSVPAIVQGSIKLGLIESILVLLFSLVFRFLAGPLELVLGAVIVVVGLGLVTMLPGLWTRPLTIEGIAGAAGIGLGATAVYLLVDVILLQNIGTYSHRWHDVGGGSNWWYHPVWWMVGTFLPWMGAWILANQAKREGQTSPLTGLAIALALTAALGLAAVLIHFPGAGWNLATFSVAFLPALALATVVSAMRKRRA
jgi:hypothetical protein